MINIKVRLKNKTFWLTIIPAMLLLIQYIAKMFGYEFDFAGIQQNLLNIVNAIFAVLAILGIVVDPTTEGVSDSSQALTYEEPKKEES